MQEIQLLLVQLQTLSAQLAFQFASALGLALAWVALALSKAPGAAAWRGLFALVARVVMALGVLWLTVLAVAWPPLLERAGNVLGPIVAGLMAVMLVTDVLEQHLGRSTRHVLRTSAGILTAMSFSLALVLALVALAWLHEPMGSALIDGRYQVTEWAAVLASPWVAQWLLSTVFGSLLLTGALAQWAANGTRVAVLALPDVWLRMLTGVGVVGLLGLLWLLSRVTGAQLNPVTQTTQTLYAALLSGSGSWTLRVTFVLWIATLAGFTVSLGSRATASRVGQWITQMSAYTSLLLWTLVCWQIFGLGRQATLAGLPLDDLASMQPPAALALGLTMVAAVVLSAIWLVWRFLAGLVELARAQQSAVNQGNTA